MSQASHSTAPVAATQYSSCQNVSSLHAIYARADQNEGVDMITVVTSIAGVLVSIIGLILGYLYWKRGPRTSRAASLPYATSQSSDAPDPITDPPALNPPTHASVNFNISINYGSLPPPSLPWNTPNPYAPAMLIVDGTRISILPAEPDAEPRRIAQLPATAQDDDGGPKAETAIAV